ncbi:MAG: flagellar type III secretion system pore protein FliP [Tepidisphaeraceae bacterium]
MTALLAQTTLPAATPLGSLAAPSVGSWLLVLALVAVLPFLLTMVTSFAKLVIVGGILRQALGTQNVPPNSVITGLAIVLTIHIMAPIALRGWQAYTPPSKVGTTEPTLQDQLTAAADAFEPQLRAFLEKHSTAANRDLFTGLQARLGGPDEAALNSQFPPAVARGIHDLVILAPAFMLTELTTAFQIGFILFVPFLVIDLVVGNILLAMGMPSMSPITIALPLKLLMFVAIDGWRLVFQGLVLNYA